MKAKSSIANFWIIMVAGFALVFIICMAACYKDISNIETRDEGSWAVETLTSTCQVTHVGSERVYSNRRMRRTKNLTVWCDEFGDYVALNVSSEALANYHVGDVHILTREVWYLKPGFQMFTKDYID